MRPVNLIPPEKRRGDRAPVRTGALPYVVVGGLAVAVVMVTFVTLIGSKIGDREAEVAGLEAQEAAATARADALRPYAEFASLSVARDATVTSLAQSRFDWERVLRELARVIPDDVWLTAATGTVNPSVQIQGGTEIEGRDTVAGPALELIGCGASQRAVAGFLAALHDIDGVTRVGVVASERSVGAGSTSVSSTGATDSDCRTRDPIARFQVVVAFDAVPAPVVPGATPPPATTPEASTTSAGTETTSSDESANSEVTTLNAEQQQARDSAAEQTDEAQNAANLLPSGVAR
jgi:Tfp pilus assembly protein PilN